jgi:hypothetical protein
MTYVPCGHLPVLALALVALTPAGCIESAACDCVGYGPAFANVSLEAAGSPVVAVDSTTACVVSIDPNKTSVDVACNTAGTWRVRAQLASGDTYAFDVRVQVVDGGCCGPVLQVTNSPVPTPSDAGIDAGG